MIVEARDICDLQATLQVIDCNDRLFRAHDRTISGELKAYKIIKI